MNYGQTFNFFVLIMSSAVSAETLLTDNFVIHIEPDCEEGEVTCDKVRFIYSYTGFEKKQTVFGKTVHTKCADRITPCKFQGYEFLTDGVRFFIDNAGLLMMTDTEGNLMLSEQGKWIGE